MTRRKDAHRGRMAGWMTALFAMLVLCIGSFAGAFAAVAEDIPVTVENGAEVTLDTVYETGDVYELPSGVQISDGGDLYDASVVLRDPDGNGYTSSSVTLDKAGRWTVEYRANDEDGSLLFARQYFSCLEPLYGVSSERSTASYAESYDLQELYGLDEELTGDGGISLSLARGDTFTYNQVLDLSDADMSERLIAFYVTPDELYSYDIARINFILTDAYDPSNSVTISVKRVLLNDDLYMYRYSYVTVNAEGQPETGLEQRDSSSGYTIINYEGTNYILHQDDAYGTPVHHSMYGGWDDAEGTSYESDLIMLGQEMSISYDAATNRFYAWAVNSNTPTLIADLDDLALFDDLWGGFSNGKAILSVEMESYQALTGNIVITQIGDHDLSADHSSDGSEPVIEVDLEGYEANALPEARIGDAYQLFPATASDETDGELSVYTSVWYNYSSESTRTRVTVSNNSFTPTKAGTYTIVYSAEDRSGNITNVSYDVQASSLAALDISYDTPATQAAALSEYTLSNVSLSGGSGNKTLSITAVLQTDDSVSYTLTDDGSGNYSYVPLYEGTYTVTVAYSDYLDSESETFTLTVGEAEGVYIADEAAVPRYAISGATYEIPALSGYTVTGGLTETECEFSITGGTDNGDGTYTVTAESGYVTLTYSLALSGGETAVKSYEIPVVAGTGLTGEDGLDMSAFFVESNYAVPSGNNRKDVDLSFDGTGYQARLIASVTNDSATETAYGSVDFVNKVLASSLDLDFSLASTNFLRVVIYVTDSVDASQQVKLTFANGGGWAMTFSVNDGYEYSTSYTGSSTVNVSYDAETMCFVTGSSISAAVSEYYGGGEFNGFTSGYVYLTFQIEGVYTTAATGSAQTGAIRIISVNNQTITAVSSDNFMPEVTAYVSKGDLSVGTVTEIPAFYACDVLDPYVSITVTVTSPSGAVVTSTDGVVLDGTQDITRAYEILLEEYGRYSISVTGTVGASGPAPSATYSIQVLDMSAPEVVFGDAVTEASVGDTVPFASVTVSDDTTAAEDIEITVYLMTPSGQIVEVDTSVYGSFVAVEAGEYRFIVLACDEGNLYGSTTVSNTAVVWYTITVTE